MTVSGTAIVAEVKKFIGDPYVYGGTTPSGFDCSGLVQYVLTQLGVSNVPRTSEEQYQWADKISSSQLQPGDLVFAQFPGDNASPGHVGIYIGNGEVLSAEDPSQGVGIATLSSWASNIVGYGRVPGDTTTTGDVSTTAGIFSWPSDITSFFDDAKVGLDSLMWLVNPASWLRIGSFFVAVILLVIAVYVFIRANDGEPIMPNIMAVPV
jgi:hypothetical protein